MESPFNFGSTVSGESFINRLEEKARLEGNLTSLINTIIISPRRWGKSSLVEQVTKEITIKSKDYIVVKIDLFSVYSEEDFLQLYLRKVISAASSSLDDFTESVKLFFKRMVPKLTFSTDFGNVEVEFDKKQLTKHRDEILNLPETIANQKGKKFIICIDEFQNVADFDEKYRFEKMMRSFWQLHKNVGYCLYGSKRHMMTDMFNSSSRAFYRFGDLFLLKKISKDHWIEFIVDQFRKSKKEIDSKLAEIMVELMDCHSWYTQQIAHTTWLLTHEKCNEDIVSKAYDNIIESQEPFHQNIIQSLSAKQFNLLKAVLSEETQYTSQRVMVEYELGTSNNVRKNLARLVDKDIIDSNQGKYEFLDPLFKAYLNKLVASHRN